MEASVQINERINRWVDGWMDLWVGGHMDGDEWFEMSRALDKRIGFTTQSLFVIYVGQKIR